MYGGMRLCVFYVRWMNDYRRQAQVSGISVAFGLHGIDPSKPVLSEDKHFAGTVGQQRKHLREEKKI